MSRMATEQRDESNILPSSRASSEMGGGRWLGRIRRRGELELGGRVVRVAYRKEHYRGEDGWMIVWLRGEGAWIVGSWECRC